MNIQERFTKVYEDNGSEWGGDESKSGEGSSLDNTKNLRVYLPVLFRDYNLKTVIDCPCGDFHWMRLIVDKLKVDKYYGIDIVEPLISDLKKYETEDVKFLWGNIITMVLPKVDIIIVRDLFVHFSEKDILNTIKNIKKAGIKYIFMTSFMGPIVNESISESGKNWRPLNFNRSPFNFKKPLRRIEENELPTKTMSLWNVEDIILN